MVVIGITTLMNCRTRKSLILFLVCLNLHIGSWKPCWQVLCRKINEHITLKFTVKHCKIASLQYFHAYVWRKISLNCKKITLSNKFYGEMLPNHLPGILTLNLQSIFYSVLREYEKVINSCKNKLQSYGTMLEILKQNIEPTGSLETKS